MDEGEGESLVHLSQVEKLKLGGNVKRQLKQGPKDDLPRESSKNSKKDMELQDARSATRTRCIRSEVRCEVRSEGTNLGAHLHDIIKRKKKDSSTREAVTDLVYRSSRKSRTNWGT